MYLTKATVERELRETVELEEVLRQAKIDPFNTFDEWPVKEVRMAALKELAPYRFKVEEDWQADWAEARIRALIVQEKEAVRAEFWPRLLNWYIFSPEFYLAARPLEFAISLAREADSAYDFVLRDVSKRLAGRIVDFPDLYWYTPSMKCFLEKLFSFMERNKGNAYSQVEWLQVERAVRCLVKVKDIQFLPKVEAILSLLKSYQAKPGLNEDNFSHAEHTAFLKEVVRVLKEAEIVQLPDINVVFGSYLREKAGLTGSVIAKLHYPEQVRSDDKGSVVEIRLELELTRPEEKEKLLSVLKNHEVVINGEGFINPSIWEERGDKWYVNRPYTRREWFAGLSCRFSVFPSKGNNRFWLNLRQEEKEVTPKVAGYIFVE